jgi:hypothetical protein
MTTTPPTDYVFMWKEKQLVTYGDIGDAMCAVESREESTRIHEGLQLSQSARVFKRWLPSGLLRRRNA